MSERQIAGSDRAERGEAAFARREPDGVGAGWIPVAAAFATILLVCAALVWAMLDGDPGKRGSGPLASGDGTGSGTSGDGPGAGAKGEGHGAAGAGADVGKTGASVPGPPVKPAPPNAPSSPLASPARGEAPPPEFVPSFDGGLAPAPAPASGEGRSGAAGGAGKDPGGRGQASFTLVWTYTVPKQGIRDKGPDVDCWVLDPLGQELSTSRVGFQLGPTPEGGRIDFDDMGGWSKDGRGGGPERAFWPDGSAPHGTYRYGVRWYKGVGEATYTMTVYLGQKVHEVRTGTISASDAKRGEIEVGTVEVR